MFWKKTDSTNKEIAVKLYSTCVDAARNPDNYTKFGLRDEIFGRFEALSIYLFVILRRLKEDNTEIASSVSQEMVNLFVADMDHSLRNARLSEKKIDKNFKRFVEGFYGRLLAYDQAVDDNKLNYAIHKNAYDGATDFALSAKQLSEHIYSQLTFLRSQHDINNLRFTQEMDHDARI